MRTQPGIQTCLPFYNNYQPGLEALQQVPDPLPSWDERSNEPHPENIGLRLLSCVNIHKGMK